MKNFPFCHSVPSCHPFRKWMALGLFAFIAGLAGTHPHAATSRSDKDSIAAATPQKKTGRNNTGCRRKKQLPEQYGNSRLAKAETFFPHRHILVRKHRSRETGIPAQNFCRPVAPYGHETGHRRNRNRYLYRPFCRAPFRSIHGKKPQGDR